MNSTSAFRILKASIALFREKGFDNTSIREIAAASGVETITTNPKTQDIWRNWEFFLKHDCHEYRLDGSYLYMYHGGANCSSDPNVPYGNNVKLVNKGVYQKLKARRIDSNFSNKEFDFGF